MKNVFRLILLIVVIGYAVFLLMSTSNPDHQNCETHFNFQMQVILPGSPERIFDLATGDISPWWDHSFTENPEALFIEPKPGGGFWEIFDDKGNGAKYAEVIYSDRGKRLRLCGPFGLSGKAVQMVVTYDFERLLYDSTRFLLNVDASGHFESGTAEWVESVWHHFLVEQFTPYVRVKIPDKS